MNKPIYRAFDIFLYGEEIDTVFYSKPFPDVDEVKNSLVNHDGYSSEIVVKERK